jgi:hypothetical protein
MPKFNPQLLQCFVNINMNIQCRLIISAWGSLQVTHVVMIMLQPVTFQKAHQLPIFSASFLSPYRCIFSDAFYDLFDNYYPFFSFYSLFIRANRCWRAPYTQNTIMDTKSYFKGVCVSTCLKMGKKFKND